MDIGNAEARQIGKSSIEAVRVRSIITCQTQGGICQKCYGRDLGTNKIVEIGTAVGIIAAQSIGEPGTQLTMRTFHMGGIAQESDITQGLTRVEELFEARTPKSPAIISEIPGVAKVTHKGQVTKVEITSEAPIMSRYDIPEDFDIKVNIGDTVKERQLIAKSKTSNRSVRAKEDGQVQSIDKDEIVIASKGSVTKEYAIPASKILKVKTGDLVGIGSSLTSGHLDLREFMELTSFYEAQSYIVREVQTIYASQGQSINDKHIEIIARQMLSKTRVSESGGSDYLPGEILDIIKLNEENAKLAEAGKAPIKAERLLLGLTRTSLHTDSWLSAASFQETIRVLVEASTTKKIDDLKGLKENVIIGKLIPAGKCYR
jgi:DNA-directed RNA polymerase subunit beta'